MFFGGKLNIFRYLTTLLPAVGIFCPVVLAQEAIPYEIRGSDEASFYPVPRSPRALRDHTHYDAVIVGGGLAGLSAAVFLSDQNKRVLVLEKEAELGGLAFGRTIEQGIRYGRGASYFTRAYDEEEKILGRLGLEHYQKQYKIHEPSDSYFWNGKLYLGIWEEKTLEELPASFALFKHMLQATDEKKLIPNQPIEDSGALLLDQMTAEKWIRSMPAAIAAATDSESKEIFRRFISDARVNHVDPMADVLGLLELYCRSAHGTTPDKISALAFANFYISEIEPRYTSDIGTGLAAEKMIALLRQNSRVTIRTRATVTKIVNASDHAQVQYFDGRDEYLHEVQGAYAVYAMQLKFAPQVIAGFAARDPGRTTVINGMQYAHYNVHNVWVVGHPYRATYDTWTRAADANGRDFADLIVGRWMDPLIRGYEGMRDFSRHPADDRGVLSLYQPLPLGVVHGGYTKASALAEARYSVERMHQLFGPLLKAQWGTSLEVRRVETNRWPYSIHITKPGHFTHLSRLLRKPYGRIFFANNNIGTPTFEEALFRGHCAANNILKRVNREFRQEEWTRCPIDL